MGLLDEIKAEHRSDGRVPKLETILNDLDKKDRAELEDALVDPRVTHPQIARALTKRGFDISSGAVRTYRNNHVSR